ncbi:MAG: hypothetical protein M1817_005004 [Caeruleum heppii]|nr:MAG: hypothetical protein M1817_005004 [Caeruleum heppii]
MPGPPPMKDNQVPLDYPNYLDNDWRKGRQSQSNGVPSDYPGQLSATNFQPAFMHQEVDPSTPYQHLEAHLGTNNGFESHAFPQGWGMPSLLAHENVGDHMSRHAVAAGTVAPDWLEPHNETPQPAFFGDDPSIKAKDVSGELAATIRGRGKVIQDTQPTARLAVTSEIKSSPVPLSVERATVIIKEDAPELSFDRSTRYEGDASPSASSPLSSDQPQPERKPLDRPQSPPKSALTASVRPLFQLSSARSREHYRPKTSIPTHLSPEEYARQSIIAAYSSRLNPFALHPEEYQLLRDHINHAQVTSYLNIRNGILRLWMRNPLVSVTREEAAGCTKDYRWFGVAEVSYQWLVRKGYINFGCAEVPQPQSLCRPIPPPVAAAKRETIVVVGAGMAGLGCARQLEGLFLQFADHWKSSGKQPPKIIVLEGRGRIGGRVYSHPLKTQSSQNLPSGLRCTAELGAQIITGFDHGNPLSAIIRGQLALHYHSLKDNSILCDSDGTAVEGYRDQLVEKLYNDILDRASVFRHKAAPLPSIEGDRELIELGREPPVESGKTITALENAAAVLPLPGSGAQSTRNGSIDFVPAGVDKLTGKLHMTPGIPAKGPAALAAQIMGWSVNTNVDPRTSIDLTDKVNSDPYPSLGAIMDEAVMEYQKIIQLTPQDMRLLNWHYANLEYANAANVRDLSLAGWDQDTGNEFEGEHAQVVGGYLQVPRGLRLLPTPLDVRTHKSVHHITYSAEASGVGRPATVECEDGERIEADQVVLTLPLGVLKRGSVQFEPALPDWKLGPISRLGFGTLNKVVLVFESAFWDEERDMFGLLRESTVGDSLSQENYARQRGRFYLFWNCIKTSGQPMLVALMAGDAAHQTEASSDRELVDEACNALRKLFGHSQAPVPVETIITRWSTDRFARGSYSYVGTQARPDDYDLMARSIGNLHFAGEATCGTHPATVHGAYLSGLRAASEVIESYLGPIPITTPLLTPKGQLEATSIFAGSKRPADATASRRAQELKRARSAAYEARINDVIYEAIGERPSKPGKTGANPFLLYQKDHWFRCKDMCDEASRKASKDANAKASRNEVRAALGQMWRNAPEEQKRPYLDQTASNKQVNHASAADYKERIAKWDATAAEVRQRFVEQHPDRPSEEESRLFEEMPGGSSPGKRSRTS